MSQYARRIRLYAVAALSCALAIGGLGVGAVPAQAAPPSTLGVAPPSIPSVPALAPVSPLAPVAPGERAGRADLPPGHQKAVAPGTKKSSSGRVDQADAGQTPPPAGVEGPGGVGVSAQAAAAATCTVADFGSKTGAALADYVKSVDPAVCINNLLFTITGTDAYNVFREAQMVTIADAYRDAAVRYQGDNATGGTLQLAMFLHAGYYVQFYNAAAVGTYGTALRTATRGGLDAFFANAHMLDINSDNGRTLSEALTVVGNSDDVARYLGALKRVLAAYDTAAYAPYASMSGATFGVFNALFYGATPVLGTTVANDRSILDALNSFVANHRDLVGGTSEYLVNAAGGELARFLQYSELKVTVRPMVKSLLDGSSFPGATAGLWITVAKMASAYDAAQCAYYSICDLVARVTAVALPIRHICDPGHTIRAQSMTVAELDATCLSLRNQDAYFHAIVADSGPVANDFNTNIQVNVFDDSANYVRYAGVIFGIDTNNGGMYLEGNPAVAGNQPNFIAYETEWLRPTFAIWNLNHEYTHYLDGRYDTYGDFDAGQVYPAIWWIEGFADYVSYGYRGEDYTAAMTLAAQHTYALSTLWDTTYANSNQDRTYRWGYLAVRYMLEKHRPDTMAILAKFRTGDYQGAYALYKTGIGNRYDADFNTWLDACAAGACRYPVTSSFDVYQDGLTVTLTDRSTDTAGTIVSRAWTFGDNTTSTATNPTHTYPAPGTYPITLTVTDNNGAHNASTQTMVLVQTGLPECTDTTLSRIAFNCQRGNRGTTSPNSDGLALLVPAGVGQFTITTSGGTGNCDLYYKAGTWPTPTTYTARSTGPSNSESLTVTNPAVGWHYFTLVTNSTCAGVTAQVRPSAAPTPNTLPKATFDVAVSGLTATFTDRSTDPDGTISSRSWNFGDGTTSTATNPTHTYPDGTYTATLTVTDSRGATATTTKSITLVSPPVNLPGCTATDVRSMDKNCQRGNRGATTPNYDHFFIYLPAGVTQLTITTFGGAGNCDLYYNSTGWAYTNSYTARSTGSNNAETLVITNPPAGYNFLSLSAVTTCSGVTVQTRY